MAEALNKKIDRYYQKGIEALDDGNWLMAVQMFNKCLDIDGGFAPARHELADIYYHNGQFDEAAEQLRAILESDPKDDEASFAMGNLHLARKQYKEALRVFKRLEQETGKFAPEIYYCMGVAYKNIGYHDLALEYFQYALEDDPSYYECLEQMGGIYLDTGRLDEAKKVVKEVLDADPGNVAARRMLDAIYSGVDKRKE